MPGAVPLDDLPDELRGTRVPANDLPGAPPSRKPIDMPDWSPTAQGIAEGVRSIPGVGLLQSTAEGLWNLGVKVPAGLAGIAGLVTGGPERGARWVEGTRDALSVTPTDTSADPVMWLLGAGMGKLNEAVAPLDRAVENAGPGVSTFVPAAGEAVADVLSIAPGQTLLRATRAPVKAARETLSLGKRVRDAGAVAPQAKAAGFDVTPSSVAGSRSVKPSGASAMLEGPGRNPEASLRNAQQLNRRLADELGVQVDADGRFAPTAFDEARLPAFSVYEQAKGVPGGPSPQYTDAVTRAMQGVDIPTEAAPEVARLAQKYSQVGDSAQLVEDLKNLRRTASKRREGDSVNQVANEALADVQMAIADELENELGRRAAAAGDAGFQERLQQARQHLAQLYETERAVSGGYVDAAQLAARQGKTGKLTGNLQLGAHMGENLPDVFQHPQTAAPASMGRTPEAWGARSFLFRAGERLGGGLLSRRSMRKFNERIPVGPNALDEFNISPVRDRSYPSPMGPNAGPVRPPEPEPPFSPWGGPLSLAPDMPEGFFNGNPRGVQSGRQLADDLPFSLQGEPGLSIADHLDPNLVPLSAEGLGRGIESDFASQLGPVRDPLMVPEPPGMPNRPRGVSGPRSAQLSDPRLPESLQLIDDTPPQGPMFGPEDEFPDAAAPVAPQGPAPTGGGGAFADNVFDMGALSLARDFGINPRGVGGEQLWEMLGDAVRVPSDTHWSQAAPELLFRGVPEGADPFAPGPQGFTTWSNQKAVADRFGPSTGRMPYDASTFPHRGTLEELRALVGAGPEATAQDIAALLLAREPNLKGFSYSLRPEVGGVPTEYVLRGP